jgi:hypothetical protein
VQGYILILAHTSTHVSALANMHELMYVRAGGRENQVRAHTHTHTHAQGSALAMHAMGSMVVRRPAEPPQKTPKVARDFVRGRAGSQGGSDKESRVGGRKGETERALDHERICLRASCKLIHRFSVWIMKCTNPGRLLLHLL